MKWISRDIETYLSAKEYVDTALVPLYSVAMGEEMRGTAEAAEFVTLLSGFLEKQFTGRILLFPPLTYLNSGNNLSILQKWEADIIKTEFKHIFYLTSDNEWQEYQNEFTGTLIWLPSMSLEQMNDAQKNKTIESQAKQLMSVFTRQWYEDQ